jgi:hypothetical protein
VVFILCLCLELSNQQTKLPSWIAPTESQRGIPTKKKGVCYSPFKSSNSRAIKLVASKVKEGMTSTEISVMMEQALASAGLTNTWNIVLFGPDASFPHGTDQVRPLTQGQLVLIDAGMRLFFHFLIKLSLNLLQRRTTSWLPK